MAESNVLLTGATGGTGAVILEKLLEAGYTVNAVLRSFSKSKGPLSKQYAPYIAKSKLSFTEIPDMAVPGVFDGPAKAASAIVHVATPIAYGDVDFEEVMIKPTVAIDENVLRAAAASGSVRRVVVTGSVVSVFHLPDQLMTGQTFTEADFNPVTHDEGRAALIGAYQFSKTNAEKEAWAWMARSKPPFDLVFLLPPSIIGRSMQGGFKPDKGALGGVAQIYRELFDREELGFLFPYFMDVDDVAKAHVRALSPDVPGNERYLLKANDDLDIAAMANRIREAYPQLRSRVPAGAANPLAGAPVSRISTAKADPVFGTRWKGWWESVDATVKDIIDGEKAAAEAKTGA